MAVSMVVDGKGVKVSEKGFEKGLEKLRRSLAPGTPVMVSDFKKTSLRFGVNVNNNVLFFSDGALNDKGVLGVKKGKRNFSYVLTGENDDWYQIVNNPHGSELENHKLRFPSSGSSRHVNEGTFSMRGPEVFYSHSSSGTTGIRVGSDLEKKFPNAFNALKFGQDAFNFQPDSFYSRAKYLVYDAADSLPDGKRDKKLEDARDREATRWACIRISLNLLQEASRNFENMPESLIATQVGSYRGKDVVQGFRDQGFPVDGQDYLIQGLRNQERDFALVKIGRGVVHGETYILPAKRDATKVVELAFSDEFLSKYYPHGFRLASKKK